MNGRTHLPRARQGAGRLQQHQRHDLPARQPPGLRTVGADPGMETWDYAHCLPVLQAHGTVPGGRAATTSSAATPGPLVLERGPATQPAVRRVLRGGAAGRLPAHRRRERVPPGGVRAVRPQHPQRPAAVRGARLPAPGDVAAPTWTCRPGRSSRRSCSRARAPSASSTRTVAGPCQARARRRGRAVRRRDQLAAAAAALGRRRTPTSCGALGIDVVHDLPGRGRAPAGPPGGLRPVRLQAAGLDRAGHEDVAPAVHRRPVAVPAQRAWARRTTSRRAGSCAATTTWTTRT